METRFKLLGHPVHPMLIVFPLGLLSTAVQALLGMVAVAPARLLVVDPHLPDWLPDVRLEGLRVGSAVVDLAARRTPGGATRFRVRRRRGHLAVIRQPPPQSPDATPWGRAAALAGSLFGR